MADPVRRSRASRPPGAPPRLGGLVEIAPEPDAPPRRDRAGAQLGMILLILGGALFWAVVAVIAVRLLR